MKALILSLLLASPAMAFESNYQNNYQADLTYAEMTELDLQELSFTDDKYSEEFDLRRPGRDPRDPGRGRRPPRHRPYAWKCTARYFIANFVATDYELWRAEEKALRECEAVVRKQCHIAKCDPIYR